MRKLMRRIRGAIGMGFTWGAAWSVAGFALSAMMRFKADAPFPIIFAVLGFLAGVIFSAFLSVAASGRRFEEMSLPRFAAWGATGGVLLSVLFARFASIGWADVLVIVPAFGLVSAICASCTLAVARRATRPEIPAGRGVSLEAGLADHDGRSLPGVATPVGQRPALSFPGACRFQPASLDARRRGKARSRSGGCTRRKTTCGRCRSKGVVLSRTRAVPAITNAFEADRFCATARFPQREVGSASSSARPMRIPSGPRM
jgi:hypothetical protein